MLFRLLGYRSGTYVAGGGSAVYVAFDMGDVSAEASAACSCCRVAMLGGVRRRAGRR